MTIWVINPCPKCGSDEIGIYASKHRAEIACRDCKYSMGQGGGGIGICGQLNTMVSRWNEDKIRN